MDGRCCDVRESGCSHLREGGGLRRGELSEVRLW